MTTRTDYRSNSVDAIPVLWPRNSPPLRFLLLVLEFLGFPEIARAVWVSSIEESRAGPKQFLPAVHQRVASAHPELMSSAQKSRCIAREDPPRTVLKSMRVRESRHYFAFRHPVGGQAVDCWSYDHRPPMFVEPRSDLFS